MAKESAVKIIKEAEKHSNIFSKVNITVKNIEKNGVRSILLPTESNKDNSIDIDNDDTNDKWREIRNTDGISNNGMTAKGPLANEIGADASNEPFIKKLLEGNVDTDMIAQYYPEYKVEAKEMIKQMKWIQDANLWSGNLDVTSTVNYLIIPRSQHHVAHLGSTSAIGKLQQKAMN